MNLRGTSLENLPEPDELSERERAAVARRRRGLKYTGVPTDRTMDRRLRAIVDGATPGQVDAGLSWYRRFGAVAGVLAQVTGASYVDAAAVLAIVSPRVSVGTSVLMARAILGHYYRGDAEAARAVPGLSERVGAAVDYLEGHRYILELDRWGKLTPARKVRSFFANIAGDVEPVTVDVWAARAVGFKGEQPAGGAYVAIAEAYRRTARRYGWSPRDLQAVVWCAVRSDVDAAAELEVLRELAGRPVGATDAELEVLVEGELEAV